MIVRALSWDHSVVVLSVYVCVRFYFLSRLKICFNPIDTESENEQRKRENPFD